MLIELKRFKSGGTGTLGILSIDGGFRCFTLEDPPGKTKIPGETRIPAGTYPLDLRNAGGMTHRYAKKFKNHRGMIWLRGVPGFRFVYIHIGNDVDDTEGCILVGNGANVWKGRSFVSNSAMAYENLYEEIVCNIEAMNDARIKIIGI